MEPKGGVSVKLKEPAMIQDPPNTKGPLLKFCSVGIEEAS